MNFFVSDLHMFTRRSMVETFSHQIDAAAAQARIFILGGDIFDFRWTTLRSIDHTIDAAIEWLRSLVDHYPACEFHFIQGNHDANRLFTDRLAEFAITRENLSWHRYYLRLGNSLFLHGDVADREMDHDELIRRRTREEIDKKKGRVANFMYDAAISARLHLLTATLANPRKAVARRLVTYLEHIGHGPSTGLRHVYFGHTHTAMSHFQYEGLLFHNGGAPIKGCQFQILEAEIET